MDFVWDNPGELVPEGTFTHSHLSWSSIVPYLLHPSTTNHDILSVQSTHLTVFFYNLSPSFLWSTSWPGTLNFILHTFLHPIIVFFSQHVPIPLQPVLLYYRNYVIYQLYQLYRLSLNSSSFCNTCPLFHNKALNGKQNSKHSPIHRQGNSG